MKVAAIDVGSNSIHLIIARVCTQGMIEIIDRDKEVARLGAGTLKTGALSDEAMARGLKALRHYSRLASRHGVDAVVAVATSAVREARNGGAFIEQVKEETGIDVRVISGREEARLIYLGAREVIDFRDRKALIIDIGGGSVEFMLGGADRLHHYDSLKLGVIRLADRFMAGDSLARDERLSMEGYIEGQAEAVVGEIKARGLDFVVGTSGTLNSLVTIGTALSTGTAPEKVNGLRIDRETLAAAVKKIVTSSRAERLKIPGMDPNRVDTIVPGAVLIQTLLTMLGADSLTACDRALREGLVVDYIEHHRPGIRLIDAVPDLRRRSVIHLARRCGAYNRHTLQVARLARLLFDQTMALHRLPAADGELLEFAGMLVDIGYLIDAEDHHKHAYYLIQNAPMAGFSSNEIDVLANVVRYHRKALPKLRHEGFAPLSATDRFRVKVLGGILRVAAGLDRSHASLVTRLKCVAGNGRLEIQVSTREDCELELWAARHRAELLEEALGMPVTVTRPTQGEGEPPAGTRVPEPSEADLLDLEGLTTA